jgi:drug/metabolite transporter (DMT)-like permease
MFRFYAIGFGLLLAFDTLSQVCFKYAGLHSGDLTFNLPWLVRVFTAPWIYGAIVGYVGSFFTWMTLLKRAPVGPAFAASHLEVVSVLILSALLFGDRLTLVQALGAVAIVGGIVCLAIGEQEIEAAKVDVRI